MTTQRSDRAWFALPVVPLPAGELVDPDGTTACTAADCSGDGRAVLWTLDLDPDKNPVLAHHVVSKDEKRAITACGQTRTPYVGTYAWWSTHLDELPLADHAIHCQSRTGTSTPTDHR